MSFILHIQCTIQIIMVVSSEIACQSLKLTTDSLHCDIPRENNLPFSSLLAGLGGSKVHNGAVQVLELLGLPDKREGLTALLAGRQVLPLPQKILTLLYPAADTCHQTLHAFVLPRADKSQRLRLAQSSAGPLISAM